MADVAIGAAELARQLSAARQRERAVSSVLRAAASSEGLQPVLDEVVEAATRLCDAKNGRLWLFREGRLHVVANCGTTEGLEYDIEHPKVPEKASMAARAALTRDIVHIPDVDADPDYTYEGPRQFRSGLNVPIMLEDELIGVVGVVREEVGPFADEHIELVETFADQAAIAIANARLLERVQRQLDQQQAIGDVLRSIALSVGLENVFQGVVEAATRLCHADFGGLYLVGDDGVFRIASRHHWDTALDAFDREHPIVADRTTAAGRAALTRAVVHIPDVEADPEYEYGGRELVDFRAVLAAPVLAEDELIGAIFGARIEPGPFADEEIRLMRTFADQAAIAIANARLIDALERQLEQQRAIGDVLGAVARSEGLQPVLDEVVETATLLCAGDYGGLYLVEDEHLRAFSIFTAPTATGPVEEHAAYDRERRFPPDRTTLVGRVALTREIVHVPDLQADPEYSFPLLLGHNGGLGVPILIEGDLIGAIVVTRPGPFDDEQIELVKTFADQAAIAIANTRLLEAVERQKSELARFISPQVAELLSSDDGEKMLAGHRRYVTILFSDLRGFTAFTETAEPEELFEVLRDYHTAVGQLIPEHQGTLEHFQGDGLMVFFNDPAPVDDHELKAVRLALAAHERVAELAAGWRKRGIELDLGIGIAAGYATVGRIGFEGRYDYGALGAVTNLASRLVAHAGGGQTLISQRVYAAVEDEIDAREVGQLELKGFGRPVVAYEVLGLRQPA